jgi:hypothetical protein
VITTVASNDLARLGEVSRTIAPVVTRVSELLLVAPGDYLIAYWLPAVTGHGPASSVGAGTEGVSAMLTGFSAPTRG